MNTLKQFSSGLEAIPMSTAWYIADLSEARGKQELYLKQTPQKLRVLKEHALIESAVSSNRIEGVEVDQSRVGSIVLGKKPVFDRNEEEVRGYRNALKWIHEHYKQIPISEHTVRELHRLTRGEIWDAGDYKKEDCDIVEKYADGRERIRFKTVSANRTPASMAGLIKLWEECLLERWVHPMIAVAAFNLDFLCIHPFRDGNGRVSRLLLLLQSIRLGYEAGHYISIERCIEDNKQRYYETLELSSQGWHEGKHDAWPYINFLLSIFRSVYREFEDRLAKIKSPRGAKTKQVEAAVEKFSGRFTLYELEHECIGVSRDMVRKVLRNLQNSGYVECLGRGPGALWQKRGNTLKRG
ncbi:MAG: Fic family protein [Candidatus Hodarchaeota archaeon]